MSYVKVLGKEIQTRVGGEKRRLVTWIYLYVHLLKYSTFSGVSRRGMGMNFNDT